VPQNDVPQQGVALYDATFKGGTTVGRVIKVSIDNKQSVAAA
jgi:hypothetical protein